MKSFNVLVSAPTLAADAQAILNGAGATLFFTADDVDARGLIEHIRAQQIHAILLRGSKPITREVMQASNTLKLVAKNGVGVDSVDLDAARELGIAVKIAKGANADAVAEHALALMLTLVRDLPALDARVRGGGWAGSTHQGRDFRGSRVGIVGFGDIGQRTAHLARALGADVCVHRPSSPNATAEDFCVIASFDELLARCDIVSLSCPLTALTKHMLNTSTFSKMKRGAILINTARGGLVDEVALVSALQSGQLAGAGLDTLEHEPPRTDSQLLKLPNVIFTPHIAGVTKQSALNVATVTANNIVQFFKTL